MTPDQLIEKYIKLRNRVAEIKDRHTEELRPFTTVMQQIENTLLQHLADTNLNAVKGDAGTAYQQVATSVTVADWAQTLSYVREHDAWDLLEARVAKQAALTMIEESQSPIPGVKISQVLVLRVRAN